MGWDGKTCNTAHKVCHDVCENLKVLRVKDVEKLHMYI